MKSVKLLVMAFIIPITILVSMSARAFAAKGVSPRQSLYEVLQMPMQNRLQKLQQAKTVGRAFLIEIAFDRKADLKSRWRAITTMGRWDPVGFQKPIDQALKSKEWFMRNSALIALQSDARGRAIRWSRYLVQDPALVVRTQAVRNLIALNAQESEELLWREIFADRNFRNGESLWVRAHMAEALARFANPNRARSFQRLLLESDSRLHRWAIVGLESSTGFKLTTSKESTELRRQLWLSRLGVEEI